MTWKSRIPMVLAMVAWAFLSAGAADAAKRKKAKAADEAGGQSLFNGKDFTGWVADAKAPDGKIKWTIIDGVIDNDGRAGHVLWTEKEYTDFELHLEWRFKKTEGLYACKIILPDGSYKKDASGKDISVPTPNADSGIYLRGTGKAQVNLWCWPCGSGELWGYRNNKAMPPEVRAGAVPKVKADKPVGQWNAMDFTLKGDRLTVVLNGKTVIDNTQLPEIPATGRIGLQNHGGYNEKSKTWSPATSFIQFRNLRIKPLKAKAAK